MTCKVCVNRIKLIFRIIVDKEPQPLYEADNISCRTPKIKDFS